ncbi:EamA family transporter [Ferrimonas balearica]|uniref:EamA family transporter n=1 Tax=Ferrimonas balearica TaxID=44012 RepID=UPI001C5907DF|nr:EamA family transporter [Ferrimonas balearica]MBW3138242.1 EamA family transporter [Ferrimonas balearica]MBW3164202.1 EamA family transporter [Ferrimonas balearica]MBY6225153.1 EamA family transporter [Ferrimonas balearica]
MPLLWIVTLIWAFSFSLIDVYIAGKVDAYFAVWSRMLLATLLFAPLLSRRVGMTLASKLMLIGAVQLGLMFTLLYHAFAFLSVPEVLLFTIMTPIWVMVLDDARVGRFRPRALWPALAAVVGAALIRYQPLEPGLWFGFALVQGANLCFAFGQVAYRSLPHTVPRHQAFGWFFVGALALASVALMLFGNLERLPQSSLQWGVLLWLGLGASGLGYFLWNLGATRVSTAQLAVMNNVLIPAGILVNLLLWQRDADLFRLALGGGIILLSLWWSPPKATETGCDSRGSGQ